MKRYSQLKFCVVVPIALAAMFIAGCGGDKKPVNAPPPSAANSTGTTAAPTMGAAANSPSLGAYKSSLVEAQKQVDATTASLAQLIDPNQQDLRGAYDRYCDNVARLNAQAESVKFQADAMRNTREDYFGKWEEKTTEIDNPTIRASAEARRKRLRDANETITSQSNAAKDAYVPFMKDLQDIKKYLANDLSKNGIADITQAVKEVQTDGAVVKSKIGDVIKTLDSVQGGG